MSATADEPAPAVHAVAVIGTGVIGASWASYFLARGLTVHAHDPAEGAEDLLHESLASMRLASADPDTGQELLFHTALSDAVEAVGPHGFIQENGPERESVKRPLIRDIDSAAPPSVVIASSSSGMLPSVIASYAEKHPERVLVGHPFNPPHIVPLVEVVPGGQTSEYAAGRTVDFYRSIGKQPIRLRQELPGHVANRLQAALWREAYSLVDRGVVSVADIDLAISSGPGLRWALLGPFMNQHLSGGPGGMKHLLEHLGPPMEDWWRDLGHPELSTELNTKLVEGVADEEQQLGADLVARRDGLLIELIESKRRAGLP